MSASSRHPSMWLFCKAADLLFRKAKERLYTVKLPPKLPLNQSQDGQQTRRALGKISILLEENPKWRLLRQILTEVQIEWQEREEN
eukprot:CAMPEP_0194442086 /NCGR_PEP_ID=MMETSP0176-20130528/124990_1 /TAXON_ID=216777 /ORGANISM="Proboscia alata, Strain PI-D3" /LENGTH=85 /DNA_ID=CAMNT_0039267973 /DNA_START=182 /DNA_END=436 /DNA_ORIENTATION=+